MIMYVKAENMYMGQKCSNSSVYATTGVDKQK